MSITFKSHYNTKFVELQYDFRERTTAIVKLVNNSLRVRSVISVQLNAGDMKSIKIDVVGRCWCSIVLLCVSSASSSLLHYILTIPDAIAIYIALRLSVKKTIQATGKRPHAPTHRRRRSISFISKKISVLDKLQIDVVIFEVSPPTASREHCIWLHLGRQKRQDVQLNIKARPRESV